MLLAAAGAGTVVGPRIYFRYVPPAGGAPLDEEEAGFAAAARELSGRVVWSSNRSGDHEVYLLDLRDGHAGLRRLTRDPHVDTFPRFSPDGTRILFNRSREPWVSFRDPEPWDVWLMNADGRDARRVVEFGFHPSFTPDGRSIVFARHGEVVRRSLDDGREDVLVDASKALGGWMQEPDLAERLLAGTVRGGRRAFGVLDLDDGRFRAFPGDSCQIAWWPDGGSLLWVESEGRGGNRIVRGDPGGKRAETLLDLPGRYSHEYFPRASRDGSWVALGASAGGHEHDRADYEIFLWKVGSPWEKALRLTRHSGNDQWPDLFVTSPTAPGRRRTS